MVLKALRIETAALYFQEMGVDAKGVMGKMEGGGFCLFFVILRVD